MIYTEQLLDRKTGELVTVERGDWTTIAELGELFGWGRRQTTTILRKMGFMQAEGGGRDARHRIAQWIVERGWGRPIDGRWINIRSTWSGLTGRNGSPLAGANQRLRSVSRP